MFLIAEMATWVQIEKQQKLGSRNGIEYMDILSEKLSRLRTRKVNLKRKI